MPKLITKCKLTDKEAEELKGLIAAIDSYSQEANGEITAFASDGVMVSLGNIYSAPKALLSYLRKCPSPKDW